MQNDFYHEKYQSRRCQVGIHNYINFMDANIEIEYVMDVPQEVLMCKVCGHMTTPAELISLQHTRHTQ